MNDVSIIIVTRNNENDIEECLKSVIINVNSSNKLTAEIIVIDNNSSDNTFNKLQKLSFPNLKIHRNKENIGFTRAVNQGIKLSAGKNIFLLNPDTALKYRCIDTLIDFLNGNQSYAACSPILLNEDGTIQHSIRNFPDYWKMFCEFSLLAYIFPKLRLFGGWKMKYFDYTNDSDVNQPMAAALIIRKRVLEQIGLMDEKFVMFFNDVDLCKKIIDKGYKIRFLKNAVVIHKKGVSVYKDRVNMIKTWNKDCLKYFEIHHNNAILILWLKFSLKISEILRILYHKTIKNI